MAASLVFLTLAAAVRANRLFLLDLVAPVDYANVTSCVNVPTFYSCENTTVIENTCCSPTPGGLVLQTQFWDTYTGYERKGQLLPKGSWTIHGLWPDNCDG